MLQECYFHTPCPAPSLSALPSMTGPYFYKVIAFLLAPLQCSSTWLKTTLQLWFSIILTNSSSGWGCHILGGTRIGKAEQRDLYATQTHYNNGDMEASLNSQWLFVWLKKEENQKRLQAETYAHHLQASCFQRKNPYDHKGIHRWCIEKWYSVAAQFIVPIITDFKFKF